MSLRRCVLALLLLSAAGCTGKQGSTPVALAGTHPVPVVTKVPESSHASRSDVVLPDFEQLLKLLTDPLTKKETIETVISVAERVQPPVLFVVASLLFDEGQRDEAVFWRFVALLRGHADAQRCTDVTARQAVSILNSNFAPKIDEYAYQDPEKLRRAIAAVLAWDTAHPYDYDPTWIAAHGMGAVRAAFDEALRKNTEEPAGPPVEPSEKWPEIIATNRASFESALNDAIYDTIHHLVPRSRFLWDKLPSKADEEFILACGRSEPAELKALIAKGANVNLSGEEGNNPLLAAFTGRRWENFLLLLESGAEPNRVPAGSLKYHIAGHLLQGSPDSEPERYLQALLDHGLNPNLKDESGYLLHQWGLYGRRKLISMLLERGAKPDVPNFAGRYPIEETNDCGEATLLFEHSARKGLERMIEHMDRSGQLKADARDDCRNLVDVMKRGGIDIAKYLARGRRMLEAERAKSLAQERKRRAALEKE